MTDARRVRGNLVDLIGSGIREGGSALNTLPGLLKQLLADDGWRDFVTLRGEEVHHERFADFVTDDPLAGLGTTIDLVRRLVSDDVEALDLLDRALQNPVGPPANIARPAGTGQAQALRKLRADRPDLHADVLANRLSAHAAMVQAGYRHPTATVPLDDPERLAATLRRRLDPDMLRRLVKLLEAS